MNRILQLLLVGAGVCSHASCAPAPKPAKEKAAYDTPSATWRTFVEANRRNDLKAAVECWVIDDDNKSGVLEIVVGLQISRRRLNQILEERFGKEASGDLPRGWRRNDMTDEAMDNTLERLGDAVVKIDGDKAEMKFKREEDDSTRPFFCYHFEGVFLRKVGAEWKIDGNRMLELQRAADFFAEGTWGPMFRNQMRIMNEAIEGVEKGRLKSSKEAATFIEEKIATMKKTYEAEREVHREKTEKK